MDPDAALAICRFLQIAPAMLLWGAFAYLAALVAADLARDIVGRLGPFRLVAGIVAVASTLGTLPLEAAMIGGEWRDALDPGTLAAVLFDTSVGRSWLVQAAAAVLLAASLAVPAPKAAATALASGLLLGSIAVGGHAAMHERWLGLGHRVNAMIHVLSGGAWLGALVPLLLILRLPDGPRPVPGARSALMRFSGAGHLAVALVAATGVLNTVLVLGRWPGDGSSPYQALLAAKIGIVAVMVALALVNRYLVVPGLRVSRDRSMRRLRLGTLCEIGLGVLAVGLVSLFGSLEPS